MLGSRSAGEMHWQIVPDKHTWVARVQTDFGGVLPGLRRVQTSRVHPRTLTSLGYSEGDGKRSTFETQVDRSGGVLTLKQGRDEASAPLLGDVHDPVSVLLWLRANVQLERADVLMAGGKVHVRRLADVDVNGVHARAFELRPGGALVYLADAPPHRVLTLVQPTDFGLLDAILRVERSRIRADTPRRRRR
ncbi:DUF3108 domain-containing protein [Deinococcus peraridilitoris]|nr:DUF3108 domain-containing protein [Deinococcus peraridilitoris]